MTYHNVELSSVEPLVGGVKNTIASVMGRHGAFDYGGSLEPIDFVMNLFTLRGGSKGFEELEYTEIQMKLRELKALLIDTDGRPKTIKLKIDTELARYWNVRLTGPMVPVLDSALGYISLPLTCFDGHAWSVAMNDEVTWGSTVIPFASDYTMGHLGDGSKKFTANGSTVINVTGGDIRPIIHVTGSGTNVSIKWGGKTLTLGSFTNSNWAIDLKEFEVTKDGSNAMHIIKGGWLDMDLKQGDNEVTVNGIGLNLTVSFQFRDLFY